MATVVVGVTGGVAAFKAPIVVRECQRAGHDVYVAATRASLEFVGRSTWEGITSRPVAVDIAGEGRAEHVELARIADLIILCLQPRIPWRVLPLASRTTWCR